MTEKSFIPYSGGNYRQDRLLAVIAAKTFQKEFLAIKLIVLGQNN